MTRSREVQLKRRPVGLPKPDDFQIVDVDVGAPGAGEVLVEERLHERRSVHAWPHGRSQIVRAAVSARRDDERRCDRPRRRVEASGVSRRRLRREQFRVARNVRREGRRAVAARQAGRAAVGLSRRARNARNDRVRRPARSGRVEGRRNGVRLRCGRRRRHDRRSDCEDQGLPRGRQRRQCRESPAADGRTRFRSRVRLSRRRSAGASCAMPRRKGSTCTSTTSAAITCRRRSATCASSGAYRCAAPSRSTTTPPRRPAPTT